MSHFTKTTADFEMASLEIDMRRCMEGSKNNARRALLPGLGSEQAADLAIEALLGAADSQTALRLAPLLKTLCERLSALEHDNAQLKAIIEALGKKP